MALSCTDPSIARRFRDFATAAGFDESGIRQWPALQQLPSLHAGNLPWLVESTREPTPFNILVRLFLHGYSVPAADVAAVFPRELLEFVLASGMAEVADGAIAPLVMLAPVDPFLVAADPLFRMQPEQMPDVILWPNATTRILQHFSAGTPSRATLDFGAGCGVISLLAAGYSDRVVATDLNPRSAGFVAFNAALNGVSNIECRIGDAFETVAGLSFDRILANPPFFVTPSSDVLFCENPMELDGFCRRVAREGAARLNEGGVLQMVCEWVQVSGQPWQERLAEWVDGTGCDAWVLRSYAGTPDSYAHQRTCDDYANSPLRATARFEQCLAYYRQRQVEEIHGGIVALRRRSGANWLRIEEGSIEPNTPFGHLVTEAFATQDTLVECSTDEALLGLHPVLPPEARLEQVFGAEKGRWMAESRKLSLHHCLPSSMGVEPAVAEFLVRCDGSRSLGELIEELAATVKAPATAVRQQCCAVIRKLAGKRFLSFAATAGASNAG